MSTLESHLTIKTVATTSHPFDCEELLGLKVAVKDFFKNLIEFTRLENIYFFLQIQNEPSVYLKKLKEVLQLSEKSISKVKLFHIESLPTMLQKGEIDVLHREDPKIDGLMQILRINDKQNKVVCSGVTHSLNNGEDFQHFTNMLLLEPNNKNIITCTSLSAKKVLQKLFDSIETMYPRLHSVAKPELKIIPLGIDQSFYQSFNDFDYLNKISDEVHITYLGRINALVKCDLRPFIQVFSKLTNKYSQVKVTLAGGVNANQINEETLLLNEIEKYQLKNKVRILKNISHADKINLLKTSDIFFSPVDNFQETFGLSIIEAMCAGIPIVCSDWGGYKDLIDDKENGFLIKTTCFPLPEVDAHFVPSFNYVPFDYSQRTVVDLQDTYEKLEKLIVDKNLRLNFSENLKRKAKNYFWPKVIEQYENMWQEHFNMKCNSNLTILSGVSQPKIFEDYFTVVQNERNKYKLSYSNIREIKLAKIHPFFIKMIKDDLCEEIVFLISKNDQMNYNEIHQQLRREIELNVFFFHLSYLLKYGVIESYE